MTKVMTASQVGWMKSTKCYRFKDNTQFVGGMMQKATFIYSPFFILLMTFLMSALTNGFGRW